MLGYNCLIQNTQLYKDLSEFVKKIMYQRVADGKSVTIEDVYREARNGNILDVDMNTVGAMYKDIAPQLAATAGKGILDSDIQVDKVTGMIVNTAVRKALSNRVANKLQEVGQQKPSESVATEIVRLFRSEILGKSDTVSKTQLREMQEALKKSALALLNRENKKTTATTTEELLKEALRLDSLAVTDLNGRLNTMDDLFNQFSEEIDNVIKKMEYGKRGMPQSKKDDIDNRIEQFRNYAENLKQGAYTLALSNNEQDKIIRDLLKEKYPKIVRVNGVEKKLLDYNKMLRSQDLRGDVADVLSSKGFTDDQIDKITKALQVKIDAIKVTSQWKNALASNAKKMLNDKAFLSRAAATIVMSKKDDNGSNYQKFNVKTQRNEPDWDKWAADHNGQTADQFQQEVKDTIEKTQKISADDYVKNQKDKNGNYYKTKDSAGNEVADWSRYAQDKNTTEQNIKEKVEAKVSDSASQYRQIVSELERKNNPAKHISKSDLEKLLELSQRRGFDELFNAKTYNMLGLNEKDTEAGRRVEELTKKVSEVLDKGGKQSRIGMSKILDDINAIMSETQNDKAGLLKFARGFENLMGVRNAYRLVNYLNVIENNLSGVNQIIQSFEQSFSSEVAKKELGNMFNILKEVAKGGKHFDMTDVEKLSFQAHEYRLDPNKSNAHNIRALMSLMPNALLGAMDSAAHAYTMRIAFYNSAVLTRTSKLMNDEIKYFTDRNVPLNEAKKLVADQQAKLKKDGKKTFKETAIDEVTDALYDPKAEEQAHKTATEILNLVSSNPKPGEIKREVDNLMLQNIVAKGLLDPSQLDPLLKAADVTAKKAIGKEAAFSALGDTMTAANRKSRERIKKNIQDGNLNKAAWQIIGNSVMMKGIFPFISGAANWGVIAAKKTPLGLLSLIPLNRQNLKDNIAMASELTPKELEHTMERYNSLRNDVYFSFQGMIWSTLITGFLYGLKATSDDKDENLLEWVNSQFREMAKDSRLRKMLTRWMPPAIQAYNISFENLKGNTHSTKIDNAGQLFGYGILENPITKAIKYTSSKHAIAGVGQMVGGIFDVGAGYNAINSYFDLYGEPQQEKVKSHSTYIGDQLGLEGDDFINGIISGMMGYNLHQDINAFTGFEPSK